MWLFDYSLYLYGMQFGRKLHILCNDENILFLINKMNDENWLFQWFCGFYEDFPILRVLN